MSSQGSNAAKNGADFENLVYAVMHYKIKKNYQVKSEIKDNKEKTPIYYELWKDDKLYCIYSAQTGFKNIFLKNFDITPKKDKRPDGFFYFPETSKSNILEIKNQKSPGSVAEKLGFCVFLRDQTYEKILRPLNCTRDISYVLSDYFDDEKNEDYFEYMDKNNVKYIFGINFPLTMVGLDEEIPTSEEEINKIIDDLNKNYDNPLFDLF